MDARGLTPEQTEVLVRIYFMKDLGQWVGPFIIGMALDLLLLGIILHQFSVYYSYHAKGDTKHTRIVSYIAVFLVIASSVMDIVYMMRIFVYNWGLFTPMADAHWPAIFAVIGAFVCPMTQSVYVTRAYRLLKNNHRFPIHKYFLAVMSVMIFAESASGITAIIYTNVTFKSLLDAGNTTPLLYATLITSMIGDLILTMSSMYALYRSKTGWKHTDSVIHRLIGFMFQTQTPPTILAIIFLVYFNQRGATTVIIAFDICVNKSYVVGLLAVLNARESLRKKMFSDFSGDKRAQGLSVGQSTEVVPYSEIQVPYNPPSQPFAPVNSFASSSHKV